MEAVINQNETNKVRKHHKIISKPLLVQSIKANWTLWLILTLGNALIIAIINIVMGTQSAFKQIDMASLMTYVNDEGMSWLQILGLFQTMGFSLAKLQVMSSVDVTAVFNDMIYSIAGVLLPMIYVIIVSNKLVASQINDGSMAYVLSTPTNRKTVIRTQFTYLILSIIAMFAVIALVAVGTELLAYGVSRANSLRTVLFNVGSMCAMFAFAGVCFGASCIFSKSKNSLAVGGGFCVFCFIAEILGLFGSDIFVTLGVGVNAMKTFNYMTILSLYNTAAISDFAKAIYEPAKYASKMNFTWLWQLAILVGISVAGYIAGLEVFKRKDLPL